MFKSLITLIKSRHGLAILAALCLATGNALGQLAQQDMVNGLSALADTRYSDAERSFIRYLAANQQTPVLCTNALNYLCMAVYKQKKYTEVIRLLEENADITCADTAGIFDYWRARSVLETGEISKAVDIIDNALAINKSDGIDVLRLYRLKGIALSRLTSSDAAENARAAFSNANIRASAKLEGPIKAFRIDNYLDWAESELHFGNTNEAERILSEQMEGVHSVTNSISAEKGAILYSKIILASGKNQDAIELLSKIAEDHDANSVNRADAIVALASISSDTNRLSHLYSVLLDLELSPALLAESKMRFGKELALKDDVFQQNKGVAILSSAIKANTTSPYAPDCQLVLANTCLLLGSNNVSAAEFKNYMEAFSGTRNKDFIAKKGYATALFAMNNFDESALLFTEAAALADSPLDKAVCLAQAADAYFNSSKFSRAAELYKQAAALALTTGNSTLPIRYRLKSANAIEQTGDLTTALNEFNDIASDFSAGDYIRKANLRKAFIYEQQDKKEEAEVAYSAVLNVETNDEISAIARLGRGRTRYRKFKFESAILDLGKVPESFTNEYNEASYLVILASYGLGQDEKAFNLAEDFIANRRDAKNMPEVMLWAAQYDFNRKNYKAAEKVFLEFAGKFPDHPIAQYALLWAADSAYKQSEFARANEILAKISKLNSNQQVIPEARLLQARSLRELTRYEDALSVLDELITDFPADDLVVNALMLKGETLFVIAGKEPEGVGYIKAEQVFSSALLRSDIKPDQAIECSFNSARCHEKAGEYKKAVDIYSSKVIDRYANYISSHIHLSSRSAEFFAKAAFNASALLENDGDIEGAVKILHHLATTSLPESEKASSEIRRLRTK